MKQIIKWKAKNGSEWDSKEDCIRCEKLIDDVEEAGSLLKLTPKELNWEGYVQQDPKDLLKYRQSLFKIANREGVLKRWIDMQKREHGKTEEELIGCNSDWYCRLLDGKMDTPIYFGYLRLSCIDGQNREWNQPYYAVNPGTGKDLCVG